MERPRRLHSPGGGAARLAKEFKSLDIDEREEDSRVRRESKYADLFGDCDDGEIDMVGEGGSREDNEFDEIVGALENILVDPEFNELQNDYCHKHCNVFEDTEENKLCYTEIFDNYTELLEGFIEKRLKEIIPSFALDRFALMCQQRKNEIIGDVFDLLSSLGDFTEFKELMLSYKSEQEGGSADFGFDLIVN